MSDYNAKNYHAQGAAEFHIGGKIVLDPGADISELVKASETINDFTRIENLDTEFSGKKYSDLVEDDVKINYGGVVVGTLKYVEGFTAFPGEEDGYFFPLHLGDKYSGQNITVKRTSGEGGKEKTSTDQDWVLKLTDGTATVYEFKIQGEETPFLTLSFSNVTLKPKADPE